MHVPGDAGTGAATSNQNNVVGCVTLFLVNGVDFVLEFFSQTVLLVLGEREVQAREIVVNWRLVVGKKHCIETVLNWIKDNNVEAKKAFSISASEVIEKLKEISDKLK